MKKIILVSGIIVFLALLILGAQIILKGKLPTDNPEISPEQQLQIYGTLTDFQQEENLTKLYIEQELYNCEKNRSVVVISSIMDSSKLIKGDKYLFMFHRPFNKDYDWKGGIISEGFEYCARFHTSDLYIDQKLETKEGEIYDENVTPEQRAVSIISSVISIKQPTQISVDLINKQDIDINFKILDLAVMDERVAEPFLQHWKEKVSYEQRLENAKIDECEIDYNKNEQIIPTISKKILTFIITCDEPIDCKKSYETCDIHEENCKIVTFNECEFYLWGQISFTDELGFGHIIPQKEGFIKQFIKIK